VVVVAVVVVVVVSVVVVAVVSVEVVVPVSAMTAPENAPAAARPATKRPTASARFTAAPV
jgi:hypothetical protein